FQADSVFSNLVAGTYPIHVLDANNCELTGTDTEITEPSELTILTVDQSEILCNGDDSGELTIRARGGVKPYQFSIDGTTFQPDSVFSNLTPGTYPIDVLDANNCALTGTDVEITEPAELTILTVEQSNVSCNGGSTGELTIRARGGTKPYQFSVDGTTFQPDSVFNGLAAGTYSIDVVDANSCAVTGTDVEITEPAALTLLTIDQTDNLCYGESNGEVIIRARGGVKPYQFAIDGATFQSDSVFSNLAAGTYPITILDANNCELIGGDVVITEPSELTILSVDQSDVLCFGDNSGELTIRARGGVKPYQFSIDGTTYQTDSVFSTLTAGTYPIHVLDANNCALTGADVVITEPAELTILSVDQNDVSCFGENNGELTIRARGGVKPYQFSIDGATFQSDSVFSNLAPGTYSIDVLDANSCALTGADVEITEPAVLSILTVDQTDLLCFGDNTGDLTIRARGGTIPYQFSIDGTTFQSDSVFNGLAAGTYTINVVDANSCTLTGSDITITEPTELTIGIVSVSHIFSNADGEITVEAAGGTTPYSFTLQPTGTVQESGTFTFAGAEAAGDYTIEVVDQANCGPVSTETITMVDSTFVNAGSLHLLEANIYPNPTTGMITIEFSTHKKEMELKVFSIEGKMVVNTRIFSKDGWVSEKIDISGFAKGVYMIRVDSQTLNNGVVLK
ncbi:MAG: T9SS type A sorting domain-containing protein, partial [Bacteroidales bacterium]